MDIQKYSDKQVQKISEFQLKANSLLTDAKALTVSNTESLKNANDKIKDINAYKKEVSEARLSLTKPMNDVIAQLISKEKEILLPLDEAKNTLSKSILDYNAEVERKRLEELNRIDDITGEMRDFYDFRITDASLVDKAGKELKEYYESLDVIDQGNPIIKATFLTVIGQLSTQKAKIEEDERIEKENQRQIEEQRKLDEAAKVQSAEEARIAKEQAELEREQRELENQKLQIERDKQDLANQKAIHDAEVEQAKLDKLNAKTVKSSPKSNIVTLTKFEIVDESLVDRSLCSPDDKKIREVIKAGAKELAGIRIYTESKVR